MADKTIVQVPVKKTDLKDVHLYLSDAGKSWNALYIPKDATGAEIGPGLRSVSGTVTADPGLWAWVDSVVVPAINAQEGT